MTIKKAIITAAGYGTRFLPATKNIPKEMLPLIDVPIIHELVKECVDSGITQVIIVTRYGNNAVEDYFDNNKELEDYLKSNKKFKRYKRFSEVFGKVDITYVKQHKNLPYGNGSPIITAKPFLSKDEAFAVFLGDDVVLSKKPAIGQLKDEFLKLYASDEKIGGIIGTAKVKREEISLYGCAKFKDKEKRLLEKYIEKPKPADAPSLYAVVGRYILTYDIFDHLSPSAIGKDGEIWLADAIDKLAKHKNVYVKNIEGKWMTTGDPLRYLKTVISYALEREEFSEDLKQFMRKVV